MKWLPGSLRSLGESLCPELGAKGDVDHSTVCMSNLDSRKEELVNYMKQDIYIYAWWDNAQGTTDILEVLLCLYNK